MAKCPNCGRKQPLKKVILLSELGTRTCDYCDQEYKLEKEKFFTFKAVLMFPMIAPSLFNLNYSEHWVLILLWGILGLILGIIYMPFEVVKKKKD